MLGLTPPVQTYLILMESSLPKMTAQTTKYPIWHIKE